MNIYFNYYYITDTSAEFLWFLLPVIFLLSINAIVFLNIIYILLNLDKQKAQLNLKTNQQNEAKER